jgi:hypothetical protein
MSEVWKVANCVILVMEFNRKKLGLYLKWKIKKVNSIFSKTAHMTPNFFFSSQKTNMGIKNAEFYADSKSVEIGEIKCLFRKLWAKNHAKCG